MINIYVSVYYRLTTMEEGYDIPLDNASNNKIVNLNAITSGQK